MKLNSLPSSLLIALALMVSATGRADWSCTSIGMKGQYGPFCEVMYAQAYQEAQAACLRAGNPQCEAQCASTMCDGWRTAPAAIEPEEDKSALAD